MAAEPKKLPIPDPDQQRSVHADVRTLFRGEYAKKTAADLRAFAAKLLQLGAETKGDIASRFVLISEGRDLAAKAADPALVLKAISQLGSEYQIDEVAMKADALDATGAAAAIPSSHRAVSVAATSATEEAIKQDRYAESVRLSGLASRCAAKSKDETLAKKATAREKDVREVAVAFELNKTSSMRLKLDPTDAGAARSVGRFRCLLKGDWDAGLPLLAQGAEDRLKDLAKQDLGSPKSAEDRRSLADGYWQAAESEKGMAATQLKRRACHYYRLGRRPSRCGSWRTWRVRTERRIGPISFSSSKGGGKRS